MSGGGNERDFYVGYIDRAPAGLSRFAKIRLGLLCVAVLVVAWQLARLQSPLRPGLFEFGVQRPFEGVLYETPVPFLKITQTGGAQLPGYSNLLLSGFGKRGIPGFARGHHGRKVRFEGSLVQSGPLAMIEMNDAESFRVLGEPLADEKRGERVPLGAVEVRGELVDTKCFLGVMRPATGKVHRACAANCLAGGVPPGLLVRDSEGDAVVILLSTDGEGGVAIDPQDAGLLMRAVGQLSLQGELPVLTVERLERAGTGGGESADGD